ncbi:MAG: DNA gyrase/topoisomerase IV subunit A, partial [Bacteroidaceae bacterium]|nr:DNA gyrase/topoisomerase IV subunit A [Bacteroidaceae bacterium]
TVSGKLRNMVGVTTDWFTHLKEKYGEGRVRRTEIRNFDTIEASTVVEANEKLYMNEKEGFIGTGLKKDTFVCNCSDIDDIIVFYRNGKMKVVRVAEKIFVGHGILHVQVFKRNDRRTTYNMVYRDGQKGWFYMKRFNVVGITRDKEYDLTQGKPGSLVKWFTANANGEAEVIKVTHEFTPKLKKVIFEKDFREVAIKGKTAMGVILSKNNINRITLKSAGLSTLGGRKVWFDRDVNRINYDSHGDLLGEFHEGDMILVVLSSGEFYMTNFDANNHYEDNILRLEKFVRGKVWTAVVRDADQGGRCYLKRFAFECTKRHQSITGDNPKSALVLLTDEYYPLLKVVYRDINNYEGVLEIDAEEFVGVKGFKAKGKRMYAGDVVGVELLENKRKGSPPQVTIPLKGVPNEGVEEDVNIDGEPGVSDQQIIDEMIGQTNLFDELF